MTVGHFDVAVRPLLPPEATRGNRKTLEYHSPAVFRVWLDKKMAEVRQHSQAAGGDPLLDGGVDSPGLERYRNAKADLTEMERDVRRGALIPRDDLEPLLIQYGGVVRKAGERLAREYGNPAAEIVTDAIDEYEAGVSRFFEQREQSDNQCNPQADGRKPAVAVADDA